MKAEGLPDNILNRMRTEDRKKLGVQTGEEAMAKFVAKSERELQDKIAALLDIRGIAFMRQRMDKRTTGTLGWPDFTFHVWHHNERIKQAIAFEAKHESAGLDPDQKKCIKKMLANGWAVYLVRSVQEAKEFLDRHTWEDPGRANWVVPTNITPEELEE